MSLMLMLMIYQVSLYLTMSIEKVCQSVLNLELLAKFSTLELGGHKRLEKQI